jgi:putative addiction module component (TIGR02574 family)
MANSRRFRRRVRIVEYLGGKCVVCGYSRSVAALQCHHRESGEKEFTISGSHSRTWPSIQRELDKCILLCAICHAELHAGLIAVQADGRWFDTCREGPDPNMRFAHARYRRSDVMDVSALLPQLTTLTVEDRLRLVQAVLATLAVEERIQLAQDIWDSVAADPTHPHPTEDQKRELERRIADLDANPKNVLTCEEVRAAQHRRRDPGGQQPRD